MILHHTASPRGPYLPPYPETLNCTLNHAAHPPALLTQQALLPLSQHRPSLSPQRSLPTNQQCYRRWTRCSSSSTWLGGMGSEALRAPCSAALPLGHQVMLLCSVCASALHPATFPPCSFNQLQLLRAFTDNSSILWILQTGIFTLVWFGWF